MTIYELKAKNVANGGKFFSRDAMRIWSDTLKNFGIQKLSPDRVRVYRKRPVGNEGAANSWIFSSITGRVIN